MLITKCCALHMEVFNLQTMQILVDVIYQQGMKFENEELRRQTKLGAY